MTVACRITEVSPTFGLRDTTTRLTLRLPGHGEGWVNHRFDICWQLDLA